MSEMVTKCAILLTISQHSLMIDIQNRLLAVKTHIDILLRNTFQIR